MSILFSILLATVVAAACIYLTRFAAHHLTFHHSSLCGTGRLRNGLLPMRHQGEHLCLGFMCPSHDTNCVRRRR